MGHRLQRQLPTSAGGSCGGERPRRSPAGKAAAGPDLWPVARDRTCADRPHGEGNSYFTKRINASMIPFESGYGNDSLSDENSFSLGFRREMSKRGNGTPIKTLINQEMSKEMEIRQPSPSLVARLMGLDSLPPSEMVRKHRKKPGRYFQKTSSRGCQEKHLCCEDHLLQVSSEKDQEFKDVFEVMEASEVRMKNEPVQKSRSSSMRSDIDMDYIREKFLDAKRLSTDKTLGYSKELDEALEVLDSNKDLFLKFLQEPNSLFTKHLQNLNCDPPSPHVSHITILKSSKDINYETSKGCYKSERNAERSTHMQNEVTNSFRKPSTRPFCHTLKEHNCSQAQKLPKLQYDNETEGPSHPTKIIVLKPSFGKGRKIEHTTSLPISPENHEVGYRRHKEFPMSGIQQLYGQRRDRHKLFDNAEDMLRRSKSSREIAQEITKQLRNTVRSSTKKVLSSGIIDYNREKISGIKSGMDNIYNSEARHWSANHFDEWSQCFSPSSSHSMESSVSREARKWLSERWKMTNHFQEVIPICSGSTTLGEILALSDRQISNRTLDSFTKKFSDEKIGSDEAIAAWGCPTGISSSDGWNEGCSRNLTRSKSLPASSSVYANSKPSSTHRVGRKESCLMLRDVLNQGHGDYLKDNSKLKARSPCCRRFNYHSHKPHPCNSGGEENKLPEREIHVNQEEVGSTIHVIHFTEPKPVMAELSEESIAGNHHLVGNCSIPDVNVAKRSSISDEVHMEQPTTLKVLTNNDTYSAHDHNDIVIEDTSFGHSEDDCHRSQCQLIECDAAVSSKETEQPSPISVLEPPSEEEKSSSGCFEKISADLKELRMQLRLLKMESTDTYTEDLEDMITSDEDTGGECHTPLQIGEVLEASRDEMSRDFSYLHDMLIVWGVHGANWTGLSDACHSTDHPIDPTMFYRLEKKYSMVVSWLKSERRMLFDLINSILAENLATCIDVHPWLKSKRIYRRIASCQDLVDDLWQMVVRQRKELNGELEKVMEPRWLDLLNYTDVIGRDIEGMLEEELFEELVSEFMLGWSSLACIPSHRNEK